MERRLSFQCSSYRAEQFIRHHGGFTSAIINSELGKMMIDVPLAQLVELRPFKSVVAGSNPAGHTHA